MEGTSSPLVGQVKAEELEKISKAQKEYASSTKLAHMANSELAKSFPGVSTLLNILNTGFIKLGGAVQTFAIKAAVALEVLQGALGIIGLLVTAYYTLKEIYE